MTESSIPMRTDANTQKAEEIRMLQAARQNPHAFGALYRLYVQPVFRYLYSRLGNVHEAEDVTAQTFLTAFESFESFRQEGYFAAWLFTIARNKSMDHFRKRKNIASLEEVAEIGMENDPLSALIQSEQALALSKLIQALPEAERELLRLRFLAEMSFPQMARFLRRNESAVKKTFYRLLARLHSQLEVSHD